jgi:hypothetical protein
MEMFVKDHADDHPEVAGYVAALTTRLDLLTDADATAVLQTTVPAYLFNYWGREKEFAPARESRRMCTTPPEGGAALRRSGSIVRHRHAHPRTGGPSGPHLRSAMGRTPARACARSRVDNPGGHRTPRARRAARGVQHRSTHLPPRSWCPSRSADPITRPVDQRWVRWAAVAPAVVTARGNDVWLCAGAGGDLTSDWINHHSLSTS